MKTLPALLPLIALLTLPACGDKDGGGDDTGGSDGGSVAGVDGDGDGHDSMETGGDDCDDGNAGVYPGADEDCDLQDDDCDGEVDEGFDSDGDGHYSQAECGMTRDDGDDCDDTDAGAYPGSEELPYDGVDQDCDGSDLDDVDGDGYLGQPAGGDDCDDGDASVHPDADEVAYDDIDQDCDGADLVDGDGDGFDGEAAGGDDCDDSDPSINPDAEDIAYDGIDQDCDGADNADLDGDGYDGLEGGGDDCNDDNPAINPGAIETPYDDVDQDCDGSDLTDLDGDGYDGEDARFGDDCDDEDPAVHPDTVDLGGDGVDADCDGSDGGSARLDELSRSVWGESGSQDYLGLGLAVCDLDADGYKDVVVSAPLADTYHGQIGIFLGSSASAWSEGMSMSDADELIEGESYFFGFGLRCDDIDGDGFLDLVTSRAEINYTATYTTDFEILVWYGDGTAFAGGSTDTAADATMGFDLGVEAGGTSLYDREFTTGDIDGDGKAEILVNMQEGSNTDGSAQNGDDSVWVVPGGGYAGSYDLEDVVSVKVQADQDATILDVAVLDDVSGDGLAELFIGQPGYDEEWSDDPGDTGDALYEGMGAFLTDADETASAADLAFASLVGPEDSAFGYGSAFLDLDGDGATDGLISRLYDDTGATSGGGFYVYQDLATLLASGAGTDAEDAASGHVYGEDAYTYFGTELWPVGDLDGDGYGEVLAGQRAYTGPGAFVLLDGASLFDEVAASDAALLTLSGVDTLDLAGYVAGTGDIDGDGLPDLVLSAYGYLTTAAGVSYYSGRVYMALSSDLVIR